MRYRRLSCRYAMTVCSQQTWPRGGGRPRRVQRILYHQAGGHGNGAVDQPLHHRVARESALGHSEPDAWRHVSFHGPGVGLRRRPKVFTPCNLTVESSRAHRSP